MPEITLESTVSEVHGSFPSTAPVIAGAGLDLCCGGGHSIEFAAAANWRTTQEKLDLMEEAGRAVEPGV